MEVEIRQSFRRTSVFWFSNVSSRLSLSRVHAWVKINIKGGTKVKSVVFSNLSIRIGKEKQLTHLERRAA